MFKRKSNLFPKKTVFSRVSGEKFNFYVENLHFQQLFYVFLDRFIAAARKNSLNSARLKKMCVLSHSLTYFGVEMCFLNHSLTYFQKDFSVIEEKMDIGVKMCRFKPQFVLFLGRILASAREKMDIGVKMCHSLTYFGVKRCF